MTNYPAHARFAAYIEREKDPAVHELCEEFNELLDIQNLNREIIKELVTTLKNVNDIWPLDTTEAMINKAIYLLDK